eukprot:CAMPEP_0206489256 /NCGR_PEP_ID=MMETSP0324_2-20121206/43076_1 /ASSEMBLY_ACC=CAM_ASM_000836 /TAXON_ID=2866 /ORGANISM="Crypthecodinium cohnii, Strain Seligo" /LENGTH=293 /DNA_ID=CAMNT_0053968789 /DNA_START=127 /DNA_END=1009 /DNA_ORIENTATION=-
MAVPLAGHMGAQSGSVAQLARLSPRNAASHFGASIEQALASVESRLKRLEEHSNVASLEQALKTAEARIQRLERERESQAQIYERVDSLVSTRVEELRRNVNRSLEVIVDKVKSETEQLHTDFRSQEAKLRKDLAVDARVLKDLEASLNEVMEETKAAREVSTRLSAIEEVLSLLTANVNSLPSFLWQMELSVKEKGGHFIIEKEQQQQKQQQQQQQQKQDEKSGVPDMDDLFNDFDAALASFDGGPAKKAPAPAASPSAPQTEAKKANGVGKKGDDDVFGDVDAFLADLDKS